jgi:hypothetical protein
MELILRLLLPPLFKISEVGFNMSDECPNYVLSV